MRFWRYLSPLFVFYIHGSSMEPTFFDGEKVLVLRNSYHLFPSHVGDIVIARSPLDGRFLIKRIGQINGNMVFLQGDNIRQSTDSRKFGMIDRSGLIGKVICKI